MEFSRQTHFPIQENSVPLLQKDITETIRILSSESLKKSIEAILLEMKKHLKVNVADLLLQNGQGSLISLGQIAHREEILNAAKYSIDKRKSFYINPHEGKLKSRQANFSGLKAAAVFAPIYISQGNIGSLYVGEPLHLKSLDSTHLYFVQSFVLQLKEVLHSSWLHKPSQTIFSSLQPLFSMLENNLQHNSRINKLKERIDSVMKVSNLIHSSNETNELTRAILNSAQEVLKTKSASLFMLDKDTGEFYFEVIAGTDQDQGELMGKRIPMGEGIVSLCAKNKKPLIVNNARKDKRVYHKISESKEKQTQNLMAVPLLIDGKALALLKL